MHRSGTSCLAGSLQESDVYFGDVSLENKYNKKGNRENIKIMNLNEKILSHNNGSWDEPPIEMKWTDDHELEGISIIKYFESNRCDIDSLIKQFGINHMQIGGDFRVK